jgi:hypothetical protein
MEAMSGSGVLPVLGLLAGCDNAFDLVRVAASDASAMADGPLGDAVDAPVTCFEDGFPSPALDNKKWMPFAAPDMTVSVDGALAVTLDSTAGDAYAGVRSVASHKAIGAILEIEVVAASPVTTSGAVARVRGLVASGDFFEVGVDGSEFYTQGSVSGVPTRYVLGTYNRSDPQRFWRVAHESGSNALVFSVRTQAGSWQELLSASNPLDLSAITIEIAGGTYKDFANPGTVRFDNFRLICH